MTNSLRLLCVFAHSDDESMGRGADLDEDAGAAVLAMQGTFYRAFSLVNGGRDVERNLFEGISKL